MSPRFCAESPTLPTGRAGAGLLSFTLSLLLIEFLDELVFGVREASWPLIRNDLRLSYTEVGLLLSVPVIAGNLVEPLLGILGDVWNRRPLIIGGGLAFAAALVVAAVSHSFTLLLVAFVIASPASGAFVGLSQAALMDADTSRHEQNMARWTLAGSLGNVAGPIALSAVVLAGASWRSLFAVMVGLTLLLLAVVWRFPFATPLRHGAERAGEGFSLKDGVRGAFVALRRREILRWLILLELADLTWDVLRGFLALYFVDVVGTSESQAALAVIVWTVVGLPGDVLLIPLLERIEGLRYLRWSALAVLILFPAFLLAPGVTTKMVLLGLLGFANAGWYSILKAQLYGAMPGQSGTVLTLGNVSGLFAGMIPLALGIAAERFGMATMMWLLLAGPAVTLVGLISPQRRRAKPQRTAK